MADRLALFMTVCAYQLFEPHMKFMSEMNFSNLLHITVLDFLQCIDTVSEIFRYCSARFRWFLNFSCFVLIGSNYYTFIPFMTEAAQGLSSNIRSVLYFYMSCFRNYG